MLKSSRATDKFDHRSRVKNCEDKAQISFRVKCVAVESERVFGDVIVTQQTSRFSPPLSKVGKNNEIQPYARVVHNQVHQILEIPDFMELNRKRVNKYRHSIPTPEPESRVLQRFKSEDYQTTSKSLVLNAEIQNILRASRAATQDHKDSPIPSSDGEENRRTVVSSLVNQLLSDIYGLPSAKQARSESESTVSSLKLSPEHRYLRMTRLSAKNIIDLRILLKTLDEHISHVGGLLIRHLRKRDHLIAKRDKRYDVITAYLQAHSEKRSEDTRMKFSVVPQPGESGFTQWLDAMKMVARLPGGIPPEFRKRLWLTLSERHLHQRGVDWRQAEMLCFNEWSNPDDEELGIQIVKDLHRTGCSLFCGAAGRDNQAVLRRVLLGFARWNKTVGYCQGLNVLAALILQVMDRGEAAAVKVMIYLIEGVLPEGYFADNLRGLSVDMAVFRDLLRIRLPKLSRHLEALQRDAKDKATGSSYEPPLTNVFTMQWFLTLFCHCLPQEAVLRVWDLIFLEGDEVLLRTALAIWEGLADRIMTVTSADEFYSIMGVLTREMLEFTDTNGLIKAIVDTGPLTGITSLREKHRYNITPWARRLSDDDDTENEEDERLAMAAAIFGMTQRGKKDRDFSSSSSLQTVAASNDRDRLALDISTLKHQYAKLRERQRQAHIILSAACAKQSMVTPAAAQAMNHLLVGKSALISGKGRQLGPPQSVVPPRSRLVAPHSPRNLTRKEKHGVTLHWKDTKRRLSNVTLNSDEGGTPAAAVTSPSEEMSAVGPASARSSVGGNADSDSDSTSTELCDEPDRLSDVDSEEPTSTSDCYAMATDDEKSPRRENVPNSRSDRTSSMSSKEPRDRTGHRVSSIEEKRPENPNVEETSITEITDQIRRLSADEEGSSSKYKVEASEEEESATRSGHEEREADLASKIFLDATGKKQSLPLESPSNISHSYHFLENSRRLDEKSNAFDENEPRVLISGEFVATKDKLASESSIISESPFGLDIDIKVPDTNSGRTSGGHFLRYTPEFSVSDLDLPAVDSKKERFETIHGFDNDEEPTSTRTKYSTSFVLGHVPISPVTLEEKLTSASEYPSRIVTYDSIRSIQLKGSDTYKELERGYFEDEKEDAVSMITEEKTEDESSRESSMAKLSVDRISTEKAIGPKTPSGDESFDSGETAGPDSKTSSLTASPRTPASLESREFHGEKTACSSVSSESKTLTLCSIDSNETVSRTRTEQSRKSLLSETSLESIGNKSNFEAKLEASSSSDSLSPERKKSSERSFSSDLLSPVSANSIKFTSNREGNKGGTFSGSPTNICCATSPFYPIANPNEKTPSPYGSSTLKNSTTGSTEISPEQKSTASSKNSTKLTGFDCRRDVEAKMKNRTDYERKSTEEFSYGFVGIESRVAVESRPDQQAKVSKDPDALDSFDGTMDYLRRYRKGQGDKLRDRYFGIDTVSPLPGEQWDTRRTFFGKSGSSLDSGGDKAKQEAYSCGEEDSRPFDRSSSSLEKKFADLKRSPSTDNFETNGLKKRSSDISEDLRHMEAKTLKEGASEGALLTRKTTGILEDLKSLEARRQDTFSDSVGEFSKVGLANADATVSTGEKKTYAIEPKIQIQEDSDSILNNLARSDNSESSDDKEPKFGVWTKVRPRNRSDNGRRSSDRALKIIQENSAILQRILTCQAKKRLPDLEQISKNITISPINEEISKIFSPILEKIGLNEDEINEELARINFKDFDQMSMNSGSEFDAKINDELSKLSLIDDSEEIDHADLDEALSRDYLDTREALIDRQINEELSKLLANYEEESPTSPASVQRPERCSSVRNASELEGLDLSSISTNVFSHKSSSDSIETKSELGYIPDNVTRPETLYEYEDHVSSYQGQTKYNRQEISPKVDIDIYRELEKLDKISWGEIYPRISSNSKPDVISSNYASVSFDSYSDKESPAYPLKSDKLFDSSPSLRSPYSVYEPYEFKSRLSPRKNSENACSARTYDESSRIESSFEFDEPEPPVPVTGSRVYDSPSDRAVRSKEELEFRVRYEDEPSSRNRTDEATSRSYHVELADLVGKGAAYYETDDDNDSTSAKKYFSTERRTRTLDKDITIASPMEYEYDTSESYHRKYHVFSPAEYAFQQPSEYQGSASYGLSSPIGDDNFGTRLSVRRRESHSLSPNHQSTSRKLPVPVNSYVSKLSPSLEDVAKRPVSHPEFIDKVTTAKQADLASQGSHNYKKSSLSLGNIGHAGRVATNLGLEKTPSPKSQFNPFPVRNATRKPKELGLKLGLYSPTSLGGDRVKRSH